MRSNGKSNCFVAFSVCWERGSRLALVAVGQAQRISPDPQDLGTHLFSAGALPPPCAGTQVWSSQTDATSSDGVLHKGRPHASRLLSHQLWPGRGLEGVEAGPGARRTATATPPLGRLQPLQVQRAAPTAGHEYSVGPIGGCMWRCSGQLLAGRPVRQHTEAPALAFPRSHPNPTSCVHGPPTVTAHRPAQPCQPTPGPVQRNATQSASGGAVLRAAAVIARLQGPTKQHATRGTVDIHTPLNTHHAAVRPQTAWAEGEVTAWCFPLYHCNTFNYILQVRGCLVGPRFLRFAPTKGPSPHPSNTAPCCPMCTLPAGPVRQHAQRPAPPADRAPHCTPTCRYACQVCT